MIVRKKSARTRKVERVAVPTKSPAPVLQLPDLSEVVYNLIDARAGIEKAYKGIRRELFTGHVIMLEGGLEELGQVVTKLEEFEVAFAAYRKSVGLCREVQP
jgi:hypothetical protein